MDVTVPLVSFSTVGLLTLPVGAVKNLAKSGRTCSLVGKVADHAAIFSFAPTPC